MLVKSLANLSYLNILSWGGRCSALVFIVDVGRFLFRFLPKIPVLKRLLSQDHAVISFVGNIYLIQSIRGGGGCRSLHQDLYSLCNYVTR